MTRAWRIAPPSESPIGRCAFDPHSRSLKLRWGFGHQLLFTFTMGSFVRTLGPTNCRSSRYEWLRNECRADCGLL